MTRYPRVKDYPRSFVVRCTGMLWRIRFVSEEDMERLSVEKLGIEDDDILGITCSVDRTVYLVRGMDAETRWEVFVHELIHVAEYEMEIEIGHETIYTVQKPVSELLADVGLSSFSGAKAV